ncbi:Uncharacterized membrane protein YckC, RDD family [Pseudomonas flavescens]|uniref:Uncharacterized membrane protein YckC, RDD family n=1 Tax=Phytopseudomonas flavescens TaxID=29435 RepID=A0A1G8GHP2_9GAMM|nr:RDD family protein [Pseudomonas flavescens]SDH93925.1 Uncharacterized membrane protein YckC, RDD family [Pseudomonas flavescens]
MPPSSPPPALRQQHTVLDTRYQVETPEGIDLALRPAGLVPRALAFTIDLLIRGTMLAAVYLTFGLFGQLGMGIATLVLFLVTWWYMVLFEVLNQGRSPGKQLLGLRVVHDDGTPIGWPASLTRNLLRVVDLLPFAYTLGIISCLSNRAFKRLGDIAAGTLVVYRDQPVKRPNLPEADATPAPFPLDFAEQRAILAFAERGEGLSTARRAELAAILAEPLQVNAEQAEGRINGIARSLLGPT